MTPSLANRTFQGVGFHPEQARRLDDLAESVAKLERGAASAVPPAAPAQPPLTPQQMVQQVQYLQNLRGTQPPAHYNSAGVPPQIAVDSAGNFYFCYALNKWAQIGSGGYSNSF